MIETILALIFGGFLVGLIILMLFLLIDAICDFTLGDFFERKWRQLKEKLTSNKRYQESLEQLCSFQYGRVSLREQKRLKEFPTFSFKSFKDFYYLNPESWKLYDYYVVKNNDVELIMIFTYQDWKKYQKFKNQLAAEKANREANKAMMKKLEFQDETTRKIIQAVQKDIDNAREEAQRNFDEATQLIKGITLYSDLKKEEPLKTIEIYEYGNGDLVPPFWDRVQAKIDKVKEEYEIIDEERKFIPAHDNYADELYLTLFCKDKE